MSRSEALRPTSPSTSIIGMTKPYSDMYTHHHFIDLEKEHSNYKINLGWYIGHTLLSFTDPSPEQKSNVPEQKVWMLQYNGPLQLENQKVSPTRMFYNEQIHSDDVKDAVKDMI